MSRKLFVVLLLFVFVPGQAYSFACDDRRTELGANFNKTPHTFNPELFQRAGVEWFRGMIDILAVRDDLADNGKIDNKKNLKNLEAFHLAHDSANAKILLSLKWDFKGRGERIPSPDSMEEKKLYEALRFVLDDLAEITDVLVSGNEPIVESVYEDIETAGFFGTRHSPMGTFYIRVTDYAHEYLKQINQRNDKKLLVGAFNRLDKSKKRSYKGVQDLLTYGLDSAHVDGLDIHIHVPNMQAFENQLEYVASRMADAGREDKLLTVSEYSMMWLFKRNLNKKLCKGEKGRNFCEGIYPEMSIEARSQLTERDFINDILRRPIGEKLSRKQWGDFFFTRSYLPKDFIAESYALMNKYGVDLATYTFDQDSPNDRGTWQWRNARGYNRNSIPIRLNPLFVPQAVESDARIRSNPYFYDSFKKIVSEVKQAKNQECE